MNHARYWELVYEYIGMQQATVGRLPNEQEDVYIDSLFREAIIVCKDIAGVSHHDAVSIFHSHYNDLTTGGLQVTSSPTPGMNI